MNPKTVVCLVVLFVFIIACAGTSEKSGTEQLSEQDLSYNPNEPWTGIWDMECTAGDGRGHGEWRLKQSGNSVVSTYGSAWEIEGEVDGDQLTLIMTIRTTYNLRDEIILKISPDGQSVEGIGYIYCPLKGKRKQ